MEISLNVELIWTELIMELKAVEFPIVNSSVYQ